MIETLPPVARYLARLREELAAVPDPERTEIVREIEQHIADAVASGRSIDGVLSALGPADALARAYAVELALNPVRTRLSRMDRALTIVGLVAVASLPSLIIVSVLAALGVALVASGVAVFAAGIASLVDPALVPDLTVPPALCLVIGPALVVPGVAAFVGLYYYIRLLVRLTMQTLTRVRRPAASAA